jgi:ParB/RepB/Spo0J family partition protein
LAIITRQAQSLIEIPVNKCAVHSYNQRALDQAHINELAQMMGTKGFDKSKPISVVANANKDGWLILSGKHRWKAAQKVGLTTVWAVDCTNLSLQDRLLEVLVSNKSKPYTMLDAAQMFKVAQEAFNMTQAEFAQKIGCSQPYISSGLKALEAVESGDISREDAEALPPSALAAIARAPKEQRGNIARRAVANDYSVAQIAESVSRARETQRFKEGALLKEYTKFLSTTFDSNSGEPRTELTFFVPNSFVDTVNDAIKYIKEQANITNSGEALGLMALDYLESHFEPVAKPETKGR